MTVRCLKCKAKLAVPDDRAAAKPRLKLKCPGCGLIFPLDKAPRVGVSRSAPIGAATAASVAGAAGAAAASSAPPVDAATGEVSRSAASQSKGAWKRCVNHPQTASTNVCPACLRGYCEACGDRVRTAVVCPPCEAITIRTSEMEEQQELEARRQRPLRDEIETIARFPLTDVAAFLIFATIIAFAGALGSFTSGWMQLLRWAILMWYTLHTVNKVSDGKLKFQMPEFHDVYSIVEPIKLGIAVTVAAWWPLFVTIVAGVASLGMLAANDGPVPGRDEAPRAVHAQYQATPAAEPTPTGASGDEVEFDWEEEWEEGDGELDDDRTGTAVAFGGGLLLLILCYAYAVLYTPVALIVAAMSHSVIQTLNPVVGFKVIKQVGRAYGEALVFYLIITGIQLAFTFGLGFIPLIGPFLSGYVESYAFISIGCLLGLLCDKNAEALGLD